MLPNDKINWLKLRAAHRIAGGLHGLLDATYQDTGQITKQLMMLVVGTDVRWLPVTRASGDHTIVVSPPGIEPYTMRIPHSLSERRVRDTRVPNGSIVRPIKAAGVSVYGIRFALDIAYHNDDLDVARRSVQAVHECLEGAAVEAWKKGVIPNEMWRNEIRSPEDRTLFDDVYFEVMYGRPRKIDLAVDEAIEATTDVSIRQRGRTNIKKGSLLAKKFGGG